MNNKNYLKNKTQEQIEFAANMWFLCRDAYINGEEIPQGVFMLSESQPTDEDKMKALEMIQIYNNKPNNKEHDERI